LSGKVGLMTWKGDMGMASFDNIHIEGPGIPGLAVSPQDKLAAMWGQKVKKDAHFNPTE